jgi:putative NADH-flavin reductase
MNVLIFGATGATGRELVQQALERGHSVTAFVRDPARLTQRHAELRHVVGDVMSHACVDAAVAGHDAILCALGSFPDNKADTHRRQAKTPVCSVGTRNILTAMARSGARRIVVETAACIGESRQAGRFGAGHIVHLAMPDVMRDKELQESLLKASSVDWTIVRPAKLKNGPPSGRLQAGDDLAWSLLSSVRRSDVAAFMLDALQDAATIRRAITLRQA